MLHKLERL